MNLQTYKKQIKTFSIKKDLLLASKERNKKEIRKYQKLTETAIEARKLIQAAATITQQQLEAHISHIVTLALSSVFDDPYKFKVQFISRRNTTECDLFFEKDGRLMNPLTSTGGGAVDIASFALRVAYITIKNNRRVLILDEPFKNLSFDLQEYASEMLKKISNDLGIQIIMNSHIPPIMSSADKIFKVTQKGGISKVKIKECQNE